jgi:hypothetical protein
MSIKNLPGREARPALKADNLTTFYEPKCPQDQKNLTGLHGLLRR